MTDLDISQYIDKAVEEVVRGYAEAPPFNLPIDHWSPSSLSKLRRCPYQWQRSYIHKLFEAPSEAILIGSAVHAGIERDMEQKIHTGLNLPTVEILSWYDDEGFLKVVSDEMVKTQFEPIWATSPEDAKARGRLMLSAYLANVAPRIQPIGTEGKISVDLGLAVPVEGRYDLLTESSCIDIKTSKRKTSKPQESWRIQAAVYGEATGRPVEFHNVSCTEAKHSLAIMTPLEAPDLLVQPTQREREQMRISLRAISVEACLYMTMYGPDEPWPTHGRFHDWACEKCGYRSDCPAWEA